MGPRRQTLMEQQEDRHLRFGSFLERHRLFIWKLCNRYADGNLAVGLNHVQEITILLWLRYDKLRAGVHPRQEERWISYIARDYFRSLSRKEQIPLVPYDDETHSPAVDDSSSDLLAEYLVCLAPPEREAVELYIQGYSSKDMAKILGVSAATARQRLHRAVVRMRDYAGKIENRTT